jgi:hypothetical protein
VVEDPLPRLPLLEAHGCAPFVYAAPHRLSRLLAAS